MKKISETIVFFGSGPVAARSLELLAKDFAIEAVVTKPRPPHHRGEVPVISVSEQHNLPIHTASSKSELNALINQAQFKSRLGILIDFGIIVSQKLINYFPLGIINSHFSVLPEWRGADPITFAVLSGQKVTGVSLMLLVQAMDEGPLLAYGEQAIGKDTTAPVLTEELIDLSHSLLAHEIPRVFAGESKEAPQSITGRSVSYSRKLTKQDGELDWAKPAAQLEREVRAFHGWPKSHTKLGDKEIVVAQSHAVKSAPHGTKPGDVTIVKDQTAIALTTREGALHIERLKPSGKREMSAREFLAGNQL